MRALFWAIPILLSSLGYRSGPLEAGLQSQPPGTASPAPREDALKGRLAEIDSRLTKIRSLTGDFEQTKSTPLLKKPLVSAGTFAVKGDRVKWKTASPRKTEMAFAPGEVRLYYPDERVVEIYPLEGELRKLSLSPLSRLSAALSGFQVSQVDAQSLGAPQKGDRYLGLELLPLSAEVKEHVSIIRVLIDTEAPCMRRLDVTDADGARTTIDLKNVKVNPDVPDGDVELTVPAGTRESRPFQSKRAEPAEGTRK